MAQVLYTCRPVHDLHPKCLTGSCHVLLQGFIKRVVNVDQHPMVVVFFEPRFNLRVEVAKKRADVTVTFHLEVTPQSVSVTMQIPALVLKCFITMCCIKFVLFLDDHARFLTSFETVNTCHGQMADARFRTRCSSTLVRHVDQRNQLCPTRRIAAKRSAHRAGHSQPSSPADPANRHAGMFSLDDHTDCATAETIFNQVSDRLSHPLLHLLAARYLFHHSCQFAQASDSTIRDVRKRP